MIRYPEDRKTTILQWLLVLAGEDQALLAAWPGRWGIKAIKRKLPGRGHRERGPKG